jgi:hypothetical protein
MIEPIDTGVGQFVPVNREDPDPVALMGSSGMVRPDDSPSRIEPQRGQVSEYDSEPPRSEHWRIFHEDESRSYFANDAGHFHPEPRSLSFEPGALSGGADILAGKAPRNHVNKSAPWLAVKGANVIPDRERLQLPVILSGHKYACGVSVDLNGTDGAPSEQLAAEYASTSACE